MNEQDKQNLASYIAEYLIEEADRGNAGIDKWTVLAAIDAYLGGASAVSNDTQETER